jgi:hypothetical protein
MKYNITKFPVIIISAPRTGSTVLAYDMKKQLGVDKFLNEPFNRKSIDTDLELDSNSSYIIKTHIDDLLNPISSMALNTIILNTIKDSNKCSVIRIRRKDVIEQIISYYIELIRGMWGYNKNIPLPEEFTKSIEINNYKLYFAIQQIMYCNNLLDKYDGPIDLDLWHEDLTITSDELLFTPKPENYLEIKEKVIKLIERIELFKSKG